jgi:hypothetical protein
MMMLLIRCRKKRRRNKEKCWKFQTEQKNKNDTIEKRSTKKLVFYGNTSAQHAQSTSLNSGRRESMNQLNYHYDVQFFPFSRSFGVSFLFKNCHQHFAVVVLGDNVFISTFAKPLNVE